VVVFFHDDPELADKPLIIRKRDGGFNYATTDVATIDYRVNELKADAIWYVVGAPQTLHFKQIFAVAGEKVTPPICATSYLEVCSGKIAN
jgi:arginyl-tRNA synthetase